MTWGKSPLTSGFAAKSGDTAFEVHLNLTPLMDVMSNILFFLLSAFGASAVAFFAVTVPISDNSPAKDNTADDAVTLMVRIKPNQFELSCTSNQPNVQQAAATLCQQIIPFTARNKTAKLRKLRDYIAYLKQKIKHLSTATMLPELDSSYQDVVDVVDAVRFEKNGLGQTQRLLESIVFSSMVP